jgi:hypothetical protein
MTLLSLSGHEDAYDFSLRTCEECGKRDKTVRERACGYSEEIHGVELMETVCDACEHEHIMDI